MYCQSAIAFGIKNKTISSQPVTFAFLLVRMTTSHSMRRQMYAEICMYALQFG